MPKKEWDWKQLGAGAGGSILALFMLQDRGIELMNKNQEVSNQVVIEKTEANKSRIVALESSMRDLNLKIESGFTNTRSQLRNDLELLRSEIKTILSDRWTKQDHLNYSESVNTRLNYLENWVRNKDHRNK